MGTLTAAGVRVLLVGVPVAHLDLLEKLQVIPAVVPGSDVFSDFETLKKALPGTMAGVAGARSDAARASG